MDETDLEEYHSIGKPIKWSNKYSYVTGTRHEEHGTRTYDVNGSRLPSVTTILGATKNQQFLKDWKAKVGEQEADRIKTYLVNGALVCTNSWNTTCKELATMILQNSDRRRKPWPTKLLMWGLRQLKRSTARKSRCIILGFTLGLLTWFAFTTKWIPL